MAVYMQAMALRRRGVVKDIALNFIFIYKSQNKKKKTNIYNQQCDAVLIEKVGIISEAR